MTSEVALEPQCGGVVQRFCDLLFSPSVTYGEVLSLVTSFRGRAKKKEVHLSSTKGLSCGNNVSVVRQKSGAGPPQTWGGKGESHDGSVYMLLLFTANINWRLLSSILWPPLCDLLSAHAQQPSDNHPKAKRASDHREPDRERSSSDYTHVLIGDFMSKEIRGACVSCRVC